MTDKAFRIGIFDFEMTNLHADFGYALCGVIKNYHSDEVQVLRVDQCQQDTPKCACGLRHWDDLPLAVKLRDTLQEYQIIVSWNGLQFDIPFLNSRLLLGGEKGITSAFFGKARHKDLLQIARKSLATHSKRLDSVAKFFEFDNQKTPLEPKLWVAAAGGCSVSLDSIVEHCIADVLVLEEAFEKMKNLLDIAW